MALIVYINLLVNSTEKQKERATRIYPISSEVGLVYIIYIMKLLSSVFCIALCRLASSQAQGEPNANPFDILLMKSPEQYREQLQIAKEKLELKLQFAEKKISDHNDAIEVIKKVGEEIKVIAPQDYSVSDQQNEQDSLDDEQSVDSEQEIDSVEQKREQQKREQQRKKMRGNKHHQRRERKKAHRKDQRKGDKQRRHREKREKNLKQEDEKVSGN